MRLARTKVTIERDYFAAAKRNCHLFPEREGFGGVMRSDRGHGAFLDLGFERCGSSGVRCT
jgi:hypothetical protein